MMMNNLANNFELSEINYLAINLLEFLGIEEPEEFLIELTESYLQIINLPST